ncbi:MAG: ATP-grasp domain-containing protein [Ekhidna sp.]|nr:ATP-grasp domain-containing protein [Ekhidna sp.]
MMKKIRVLVLDCDRKNSLAIIRDLGKQKIYKVDGISHSKYSIGFFSKFISKKYITRNPKKDGEGFLNDLLKIIQKGKYDVVLPVSHVSHIICSFNSSEIKKWTNLIVPTPEQIDIATHKTKTYEVANKLGIQTPLTIQPLHIDDVESIEISFPCVIKAPIEVGKNLVEYAFNREDMIQKFRKMDRQNDFGGKLPIVQEYLTGHGAGFFAFYEKGECRNYFMHRRIREYPPSGGVSACAESFKNQEILEKGKLLLDYLKWNGVAMVEFKKNETNDEYNLLEINAKFWGSVELSRGAGVNFPRMIIEQSTNKAVPQITDFEDVRFQWILSGDLLHILERPWNLIPFLRDLLTAKNDFYFSDIKPNLMEFLYIPIHYYKKWFK